MNTEEMDLLKRASNEIKDLRRQNEAKSLRLDMFDSCMMLLTANLNGSQLGMGEDVAWQIDKAIADHEEESIIERYKTIA